VQKSNYHILFDKLYPNSYYPYILQKIDMIIAILLFSIAGIVYFITLNPSVTAGDSGELITTVYNMGASHPPGFPLYGIIGKLFTFLQFSDIGYKLNIFSGVSAAIAVLFAYLSLVKLLGFNRNIKNFDISVHIPAIAASLVFAFSKAHWSQAVMAEVYALNAALCSIMFFIMILWYEEIMTYRNEANSVWLAPRITLLLVFVMGLSITNHQIPVWYIIAWALMLVPIIYLVISFKGRNFIEQLQRKRFVLILFGLICVMALILLFISAIKPYLLFPDQNQGQYRLVYPQHVPYLLSAILCVPIWLTIYSIQNILYKIEYQRRYSNNIITILNGIFWIIIITIVGIWIYFLQGINGILISLPMIILVLYQYIQKKELFKDITGNWVDQFLFIFTIAMWLLVFALSIYLYMWIRAKAIAPLVEPKPLSWGDTQTIDILINHMLRKQYPVGDDNYSNVLGQLLSLVTYHIGQFGVINTILGCIGIGYFIKREPVQSGYFILASIIYLWSIVDFTNFVVNPRSLETQEVFFIQQFLIYTYFIGFAYQFILDFFNKKIHFKINKNISKKGE